MQNNIIDFLGFKDKDIIAKVTKSAPTNIEITVSKVCKPLYCSICNHRMYSRGPYTRTLNHPILQDGRTVTIILKQRRWKCTNPVCEHFETDQFSFVERYKHNTNMTDFMIITDMYRPFESYVSSYFPNAIHIVDSFHVIQLINRHLLGYIRRKQRDSISRGCHRLPAL